MKLFKTISAIALAFLVLLSSTSFVIGMHVCMGDVQKVALFAKADGCKKDQKQADCHRQSKSACCEDDTVVHNGDDLEASLAKVSATVSACIECSQPLVLVAEIIPPALFQRLSYQPYDPPLRSYDRTVEHHVLLI